MKRCSPHAPEKKRFQGLLAGVARHPWLLRLFVAWALGPVALMANPQGGSVVSGSAAMSSSGNTLTVTNSNGTVINWNSFSIAAGEATKFLQPNASSAILNRVTGTNLSEIYGSLSSNGHVFLVNPNGVLIGASGMINTAGFVASTLDIANHDFQSGNYHFAGAGNGSVQNLGTIQATSGDVYILARQVDNQGTIQAAGKAGLYAGDEVYLATSRNGEAAVRVSGTSFINGTGIQNGGLIQAAQAELKATGNMYALAINNSGVVRATGTTVRNGVVRLVAIGGTVNNAGTLAARNAGGSGGTVRLRSGAGGTTQSTGTIDVAGTAPGTRGGVAELTGDHVGLTGSAAIDASGPAGGGIILVGGDAHGANPDVYDASAAYVGSGVVLDADATGRGDGGKVVVWGDDATRFYGTISVRGGPDGGNGGWVETSGHYLDMRGQVVLDAPGGRGGSWLLDPYNLTIGSGTTTAVQSGTAPDYTEASANSGSFLDAGYLSNTLLVPGATITVTTVGGPGGENGDITVNSAITGSESLILSAAGSVVLNANITVGDQLGIGAGIDITQAAGTTLIGGTVSLTAGGDLTLNGTIDTAFGAVTLQALNIVLHGATVDATAAPSGGDISLYGASSIVLDSAGGRRSYLKSGGGDIYLGNPGNSNTFNPGGTAISITSSNIEAERYDPQVPGQVIGGGSVTLRGQSGAGNSFGIVIGDSEVSTAFGDLGIYGANAATGIGSIGVNITNGSTVSDSGSSATLTIQGSSEGASISDIGIRIDSTGATTAATTISATGGASLDVEGTVLGAARSGSFGVQIEGQVASGTTSLMARDASGTWRAVLVGPSAKPFYDDGQGHYAYFDGSGAASTADQQALAPVLVQNVLPTLVSVTGGGSMTVMGSTASVATVAGGAGLAVADGAQIAFDGFGVGMATISGAATSTSGAGVAGLLVSDSGLLSANEPTLDTTGRLVLDTQGHMVLGGNAHPSLITLTGTGSQATVSGVSGTGNGVVLQDGGAVTASGDDNLAEVLLHASGGGGAADLAFLVSNITVSPTYPTGVVNAYQLPSVRLVGSGTLVTVDARSISYPHASGATLGQLAVLDAAGNVSPDGAAVFDGDRHAATTSLTFAPAAAVSLGIGEGADAQAQALVIDGIGAGILHVTAGNVSGPNATGNVVIQAGFSGDLDQIDSLVTVNGQDIYVESGLSLTGDGTLALNAGDSVYLGYTPGHAATAPVVISSSADGQGNAPNLVRFVANAGGSIVSNGEVDFSAGLDGTVLLNAGLHGGSGGVGSASAPVLLKGVYSVGAIGGSGGVYLEGVDSPLQVYDDITVINGGHLSLTSNQGIQITSQVEVDGNGGVVIDAGAGEFYLSFNSDTGSTYIHAGTGGLSVTAAQLVGFDLLTKVDVAGGGTTLDAGTGWLELNAVMTDVGDFNAAGHGILVGGSVSVNGGSSHFDARQGSFWLTNAGVIDAGSGDITIAGSGEIMFDPGVSLTGTGNLVFQTSASAPNRDFAFVGTGAVPADGAYFVDADPSHINDATIFRNGADAFASVTFAAAPGGNLDIVGAHLLSDTDPSARPITFAFTGTNVVLAPGSILGTGTAAGDTLGLVASGQLVLNGEVQMAGTGNGNHLVLAGQTVAVGTGGSVQLLDASSSVAVFAPAAAAVTGLVADHTVFNTAYSSGVQVPAGATTLYVASAPSLGIPPRTPPSPRPGVDRSIDILTSSTATEEEKKQAILTVSDNVTDQTAVASTNPLPGNSQGPNHDTSDVVDGKNDDTPRSKIQAPPTVATTSSAPSPANERVVGAGAVGALGAASRLGVVVPPPPALGNALTPAVRSQLAGALRP